MQFWSHLSNFLQGSLCSDPLPSILVQNFWNGFFGKGSSLRRVPWMIMTSPEYFLKSKQSKRCRPGNQLDKAAQERGHRVITHARQRTLSHHVSLQSRDAMASIPSFWHYATELWIGSPGKALAGIATWWQERKDFWQLAPMGGAYPWLPLRSLSCHLDNRSRDCLGSSPLPWTCTSWSCSASLLFNDPAHRGDLRNPHSLNSTYLHQRRKDGNKSYPSKTKTVQILLWPGRRPSFHFNHFETNSSWHFLDLLLLLLNSQICRYTLSREAHMKCTHRPSTWTLSREAHMKCTHRPSTWILVSISLLHVLLLLNVVQGSTHEMHW